MTGRREEKAKETVKVYRQRRKEGGGRNRKAQHEFDSFD